ncbi:hypothetical protein Tco_0475482 [Tanacetum coccineum]
MTAGVRRGRVQSGVKWAWELLWGLTDGLSGIRIDGLGGASKISSRNGLDVPKVDEVSLVDGVFEGALGGDGNEDFAIEEGVVVSSSSFVKSTNNLFGGMMVILALLEGLKKEAWVEAMEVEE